MEVKEAVELAKAYVADLFQAEGIAHLGLEEVEYDDQNGTWKVTVGFSRPWEIPSHGFAAIAQQVASPKRSYKVVTIIDLTRKVVSVKNRETKS